MEVFNREIIKDKLRQNFDGKIVRKDLTKKIKEGANVPVYVLEYLLGMYCATNDDSAIEDGVSTVKKILADNFVRPDEAEKIKSTIDDETLNKLAKYVHEVLGLSNLNCDYDINNERCIECVRRKSISKIINN